MRRSRNWEKARKKARNCRASCCKKSIPSDVLAGPFEKARLFCAPETAGAAKATGRMRSFLPAFLLRFHTKNLRLFRELRVNSAKCYNDLTKQETRKAQQEEQL